MWAALRNLRVDKAARQVTGRLPALRRILTGWYVVGPVVVAIGVAAGILAFVYAAPGKPSIGVINLPFAVITDDTAIIIGEYLNYARRDDSIKAVVISISSPGGSAAASERMYLETRKLRAAKPVVLVMNGLVASGGYMMAMGANHTYVQTSSLVGNVGVIAFSGPLIPRVPPETVVLTGPDKLSGGSRQDWIEMIDQLKAAFAQLVIRERGEKLRISEDELVRGRIYSGVDAVRLGLADELGGYSDGVAKAAELAGIANYGFVDVNSEVQREFLLRVRRIFAAEHDGAAANWGNPLTALPANPADGAAFPAAGPASEPDMARLQKLRQLLFYESWAPGQENPLPEFPLDIRRPNIYYLYAGYDD